MKWFVLTSLLMLSHIVSLSQNWNKLDSTSNNNVTDTVWRSGSVMISDYISNPANNKLGIVAKYDSTNNRGLYVSLNEPNFYNFDGDSTRVGLAKKSNSNYTSLIATNYANFDKSVENIDVHNATSEFSFNRGMPDAFGFRDGGNIKRAAVLRLTGSFGNNSKAYETEEFDLLNLRLFTSSTMANMAKVDKFYAIRLEDLRGVNYQIITKGWGIYMKPKSLNNYFGGKVGNGIELPTAALSIVSDTLDPLSLNGLKNDNSGSDIKLLSVNVAGVVHSKYIQSLNENFNSIIGDVSLNNDTFLYVHKGADATYTLPPANTRTGKTWKIVNVGSGIITFTESFYEGDVLRNTLLNKAGFYSLELFSDGINYIALK
jgi:hypothetical protein